MTNMVQAAETVAALVSGIAESAHAQQREVSEVDSALTVLDQATQQDAARVAQLAAAANDLRGQAQSLAAAMRQFRVAPAA